jgi:hypothetical protein
MKRVMFSCATAGYNNINFAVMTAGSGKALEEKTSSVVQ